jgi:hypothetical protein
MALNNYKIKRSADGSTIWLTLPREEWREIEGGCACEYCSDNGKSQSPAYWDTLSMSAKAPTGHGPDYPYAVHYPEMHGAQPKPKVIR